MGAPKPFASLSSGLLARKGQAKPAMRPQGFSGFGAVSEAIDDLGWNDMGLNETQPGPAPVALADHAAPEHPVRAPMPPVLRQRTALHEEYREEASTATSSEPAAEAGGAPVAPVARASGSTVADKPVTQRRSPTGAGAKAPRTKAAFTLRLDADRHFRLRLASALRHVSAQHLVTEALDMFLKSLPEVEEMATQLSSRAHADHGKGG
ncbi:MAG: hypothetical protein B7Y45_06820 [Sphingomonas sp. 28-66-16]|nr:MAG: hypothetical protein B7Y45_06820 [Sphingomonas sp. 28-66-16]